jgi:hypothetical protein
MIPVLNFWILLFQDKSINERNNESVSKAGEYCIYGIQFNAKFLASYPYFQGSKDGIRFIDSF